MKEFLNKGSWIKDSKGCRHYDEVDVLAGKYNILRKKLEGKKYNRFEMVALLSKNLNYYLSFEVLPALIKYGLLEKPLRGVYTFPSKPVYKTKVYICLAEMRVNRLGK